MSPEPLPRGIQVFCDRGEVWLQLVYATRAGFLCVCVCVCAVRCEGE